MVWLPKWLGQRINPVPFLIDDFIIEAAKGIYPGSIILDAGAGECKYAYLFSHCSYISIDFAKGEPKWNYKRLSIIGDILSLPLKNSSVDAVICTQTLEHVNEPIVLLNELYRVLKINGRLYLTAPLGWPIHQSPYDFFRFTYFGLEYLLRKSGFDIEFIQPQGGYFLYLSSCIQHMHRVLFPKERTLIKKVLLAPLQFLIALFGSILIPLVLYYMDIIFKGEYFTLNYKCFCRKG